MKKGKYAKSEETSNWSNPCNISTDDSYLEFDLGMAKIRSMWSLASFRRQLDAPN